MNIIGFAGRGGNVTNGYPPYSNDLNPVENVIHELKKGIWKLHPKSMNQLYHAINKSWNQLKPEQYIKSIMSMNRRLSARLEANGEKINY